jgi:hypothetical protein
MRECVHYSPVRYGKNAAGLVLCSEVVSLQHLRTYYWRFLQSFMARTFLIWQDPLASFTQINDTQLCRSCKNFFKVITVWIITFTHLTHTVHKRTLI